MLDVIFVAMFAAMAGQPQTAAPAPAPATETTTAPPVTTANATPAEAPAPRRECRREISTGSNLPRLVCRSVYQADLEREIGHDIMEEIQGVAVERPKP